MVKAVAVLCGSEGVNGKRQEVLSVHVAGKNQLENCEMYVQLSLSPFVCIQ
jgi:hypothetical protein